MTKGLAKGTPLRANIVEKGRTAFYELGYSDAMNVNPYRADTWHYTAYEEGVEGAKKEVREERKRARAERKQKGSEKAQRAFQVAEETATPVKPHRAEVYTAGEVVDHGDAMYTASIDRDKGTPGGGGFHGSAVEVHSTSKQDAINLRNHIMALLAGQPTQTATVEKSFKHAYHVLLGGGPIPEVFDSISYLDSVVDIVRMRRFDLNSSLQAIRAKLTKIHRFEDNTGYSRAERREDLGWVIEEVSRLIGTAPQDSL